MIIFCVLRHFRPQSNDPSNILICALSLYFIFNNGFTAKLIRSERVKSMSLFSTG